VNDLSSSTSAPTQEHQTGYGIASEELAYITLTLKSLSETDIQGIERAMDALGAPYTPGRSVEWKEEK
jgi:hypothetical protein